MPKGNARKAACLAAMSCFTFAGLTWIAVMMMRNHEMANRIAAFGVAWWIVGFALTPIAVYYHSRARMRGLWPT
jgi:glucan phosphoethanolaminetransferase (alkaline phosphatase superfamily)